jgi:hypothetical protein
MRRLKSAIRRLGVQILPKSDRKKAQAAAKANMLKFNLGMLLNQSAITTKVGELGGLQGC